MKLVDMIEWKADKSEMILELEIMKKEIQNDKIECFMIVALDSDGRQILRTSKCSGYKKAFMVQFLNSWMSSWFHINE